MCSSGATLGVMYAHDPKNPVLILVFGCLDLIISSKKTKFDGVSGAVLDILHAIQLEFGFINGTGDTKFTS